MRDLSKLNRDLGKVLLVACDPDAYALQPENAIKVCSPSGQCVDRTHALFCVQSCA